MAKQPTGPVIVDPSVFAFNEIHGTWRADVLEGTAASDILYGLGGNDYLYDSKDHQSSDRLYGGAGNDILSDGGGSDLLDGGEGDDYFEAGTAGGSDRFVGGNGYDTLDLTDFWRMDETDAGLRIDARDGTIRGDGNTVDRFEGIEKIVGTYDDDVIHANSLGMTLDGEGGTNVLVGGAGRDTLISQGDHDTLTGGGGRDTFVVTTSGYHAAIVTDFQSGTDKIDVLQAVSFPGGRPWMPFGNDGVLAKGRDLDHASSLNATDNLFFDTDDATLYSIVQGKTSSGNPYWQVTEIAHFKPGQQLTAADIVVAPSGDGMVI